MHVLYLINFTPYPFEISLSLVNPFLHIFSSSYAFWFRFVAREFPKAIVWREWGTTQWDLVDSLGYTSEDNESPFLGSFRSR